MGAEEDDDGRWRLEGGERYFWGVSRRFCVQCDIYIWLMKMMESCLTAHTGRDGSHSNTGGLVEKFKGIEG